jgi:hypothetical protein
MPCAAGPGSGETHPTVHTARTTTTCVAASPATGCASTSRATDVAAAGAQPRTQQLALFGFVLGVLPRHLALAQKGVVCELGGGDSDMVGQLTTKIVQAAAVWLENRDSLSVV